MRGKTWGKGEETAMICGKRQIQNRIFGEIYRLQIGEECVKL